MPLQRAALRRGRAVAIAAAGALVAVATAHAQSQHAGDILWKVGANTITPKVRSGDLSAPSLPGTKIDIHSASSVIATVTYMVTDKFSVELFGGLPYEHTVVGAGAIANVGKLGTIKQVSPTVMAQYNFASPLPRWSPYVGAGVTYAYFYDEQGSGTLTALTNPGGPPTRLSADSAWGQSVQAGTRFELDKDWHLDGSVTKTWVQNTTQLSTGQNISAHHDPVSIGISVARQYK